MRARSFLAAVLVIAVTNVASADTIRGINIDFVTIGNADNPADTTTGCGAVGYNYRIGKYEVTNAQWNAFGAATGSWTNDAGVSQQPINEINWYQAAVFCNYLTSGNGSLGAYHWGIDGGIAVDRTTAQTTYGIIYVLPTLDEWYKAAYYKPDDSGYSLYANGTNTAPSHSDARYDQFDLGFWDVGSGTMEQNGTFDMMGNNCEWSETAFNGNNRDLCGGSYAHSVNSLAATCYPSYIGEWPGSRYANDGFRVASIGVIPEPATIGLLGLGALGLLRKHKA